MVKYMRTLVFLILVSMPIAAVNAALAPITRFEERREMNFATIIVDLAGDVIRIRNNGRATAQNNSILTGNAQSARFHVRGEPNTAFEVSFSSGDTLTGPGAAMGLGTFTRSGGNPISFNNRGRRNFNVGARLTINPNQTPGTYSGTYTVTVDYP